MGCITTILKKSRPSGLEKFFSAVHKTIPCETTISCKFKKILKLFILVHLFTNNVNNLIGFLLYLSGMSKRKLKTKKVRKEKQ